MRARTRLAIQDLEPRDVPAVVDQLFESWVAPEYSTLQASVAYFSVQQVGTTFTVGISGILTEVAPEVDLFSPASTHGTLIMDVRRVGTDGFPVGGDPLVTRSVTAEEMGQDFFGFWPFDVSAANIFVNPGDKLALILHVMPEDGADATYWWGGDNTNEYTGGKFVERLSPDTEWLEGLGGDDWDLGFRTMVEPMDPPANQPPTVTLAGGGVYVEDAAPLAFVSSATVIDVDTAGFDGGTLTASIIAGMDGTDALGLRHEGTGAGQIGVGGNTVSYGGTAIGTFSVGAGSLTVALNAAATADATAALIRSLTFHTVSDDPSTIGRGIRIVLDDGEGGSSDPVAVTVTVQGVNDAPSLSDFATLPAVAQADADPASMTVGQLLQSIASDVDGTIAGIAVVGNTVDLDQGRWQYMDDILWRDVGEVSDASALALDAGTRLRYLPAPWYFGAPAPLAIRAIDDTFAGPYTNDEFRHTIDASTPGGASAVSADAHGVEVEVTLGDVSGAWQSETGSVFVAGTAGDDKIRVLRKQQGATMEIRLGREILGSFSTAAATGRLTVRGFDGNDVIKVAAKLNNRTELFGGAGNDKISTNNSPAVLVGGSGDDTLVGGRHNDLLFGGTGADRLKGGGGAGSDLLVSGGLATEIDAGDATDYRPFRPAWEVGPSYEARVAAVEAMLLGQMADDSAVDKLAGGKGLDAFFIAAGDLVKGLADDETTVTL